MEEEKIDLREINLRKKCYNCSCFVEVAGGPDHGDLRCTNQKSPAYNMRINELEKDELGLLEKCSVRKGTRTAIVTGASRGIGAAIVERLAQTGSTYDIAIISRNLSDVERFIHDMINKSSYYRHYGGCFAPFECDVSDPIQVAETFRKINRDFGSIDVLVNNAGVNSRRTIPKSQNLEDWTSEFDENLRGFDEEIATNLRGAFICSYIAASYMKQQKKGCIINISSIKGKEPTTSPGYGASKAGIIKLTRDFAKALAPDVRVNCIAPGFINTGMTAELPEDKKEAYKKLIPAGRFGEVGEVANAVEFLASEKASYITGAVLDVNGGYLMS